MGDHATFDVLNDDMDLHMSSLGTLVPEGPWCVFYVTRLKSDTMWFFTVTLISHTQTNTVHSGASRLTHP